MTTETEDDKNIYCNECGQYRDPKIMTDGICWMCDEDLENE